MKAVEEPWRRSQQPFWAEPCHTKSPSYLGSEQEGLKFVETQKKKRKNCGCFFWLGGGANVAPKHGVSMATLKGQQKRKKIQQAEGG